MPYRMYSRGLRSSQLVAALSAKLLRARKKNPNQMRRHRQALRVYLLNDADLTFLHSLEVSEEDFSALKAEQGILVDFGSFPAKLVSLLEKCIAARVQDPPRCVHRRFIHLAVDARSRVLMHRRSPLVDTRSDDT